MNAFEAQEERRELPSSRNWISDVSRFRSLSKSCLPDGGKTFYLRAKSYRKSAATHTHTQFCPLPSWWHLRLFCSIFTDYKNEIRPSDICPHTRTRCEDINFLNGTIFSISSVVMRRFRKWKLPWSDFLPVSLALLPCSSSFCFFFLSSFISRSNAAFHARKFSMVTTVPWNATCRNQRRYTSVLSPLLWTTTGILGVITMVNIRRCTVSFCLPSLLPLLLFLSVVSLLLSCFSSHQQFHSAFPGQLSPRWKSSPFPGFLLPAGIRPMPLTHTFKRYKYE